MTTEEFTRICARMAFHDDRVGRIMRRGMSFRDKTLDRHGVCDHTMIVVHTGLDRDWAKESGSRVIRRYDEFCQLEMDLARQAKGCAHVAAEAA